MTHKIAIMQPYFLPYMGYWQLIANVDEFVIYDNIQYTKKGWITRNRFLLNGKDEMFSLSLKADSDFLPVSDRFLSPAFDREKLVRQLQGAYQKAPYYKENFPVIEEIIRNQEQNLSAYINASIQKICSYLFIETPLVPSSSLRDSEHLKGQDKVLDICRALKADTYINPVGGLDLYDRKAFLDQGINLSFLRSRPLAYAQFGQACIPHMSILDVLMFNSRDQVMGYLQEYDLI
jgi:hypothetical protein